MTRSSALRSVLCLLSAGVLALLGVVFANAPAQAAGTTRYVSTTGDDTDNDCTDSANPCLTIQNGVNQANPGDTVSIAAGTYDESVRIRASITLLGAGTSGANDTVIDGDDGPSIFVDGVDTNTPPVVTIKNLDVSGNGGDDGIFVDFADAHVVDCVVSNNNDDGIEVEDDSTVTVKGSTVDGNGHDGVQLDLEQIDIADAAAQQGDDQPAATTTDTTASHNNYEGVEVDAGIATVVDCAVNDNEFGGVVAESGEVDVTGSTLDGNIGAGMVLDGDGNQGSLTTSTVSNTVPFGGDGGEAFGGGVLVFPGGEVAINTSTIFGNTGQGVLSWVGDTTIDNTTISGTIEPSDGTESGGPEDLPYGGIAVDGAVPEVARRGVTAYERASSAEARSKLNSVSARQDGPGVTVTGTIDADNTSLADCNGDVVDGGYNLDSDGSCAWSATGSISKGNAKLGPLQNNGGSTKTLLPAKGSDAIDQIPTGSANCSTSASDQRGESRPQGTKCDIGAVEAAQPPIMFTPHQLPHGEVGVAYHAQISATGGLGAPYEFSLAPGSKPLPDGLTLHTNGKISGTPTKAGTYPITVSVDDPTLHHYVIVITAPPTTPPPSTPTVTPPTSGSIASTGTPVAPLSLTGVLAILAGVLLLVAAGWRGSRAGRHRTH